MMRIYDRLISNSFPPVTMNHSLHNFSWEPHLHIFTHLIKLMLKLHRQLLQSTKVSLIYHALLGVSQYASVLIYFITTLLIQIKHPTPCHAAVYMCSIPNRLIQTRKKTAYRTITAIILEDIAASCTIHSKTIYGAQQHRLTYHKRSDQYC